MKPSRFDEDVVPDAREVFPDSLMTFSRLLEQRQSIVAQIEQMTEEKKDLDSKLMEMMTERDTPKVMYGDTGVTIVQGTRHNLSKEKLVELGVPVSTIKAATTTTQFSYLLVK